MVWSHETSELVAEFVGTFLFVLTITLATIGIGSLAPLAIGFMLMAMVFTFGYISGGHFNPAITFATFITRHTPLRKLIRYVIVQVLAGIMSTLYASAIVGLDVPVPTTDTNIVAVWQSLLSELVYTFALACVVLHVAYSRQRTNSFYGFAIGMTLMAAAFSVGGFTGGAFNPAVATGIQLVACFGGNCSPLIFTWMYWVAPMGGAFLGGFAYNLLDTNSRETETAAVPAITH
ncbi:aquaporin 9, putative [Bodo saltans]|uniref:Aquaporin 9, putative n=1 Tax=Bodo saltans TaxID=75058 RepID=A0A0S4KLV5_BODSA|nr:aquaporin 9, putative [Bodo saltans]|eukprot:CUI15569.1 aquaporin 9, putative [Bodo saltans]